MRLRWPGPPCALARAAVLHASLYMLSCAQQMRKPPVACRRAQGRERRCGARARAAAACAAALAGAPQAALAGCALPLARGAPAAAQLAARGDQAQARERLCGRAGRHAR